MPDQNGSKIGKSERNRKMSEMHDDQHENRNALKFFHANIDPIKQEKEIKKDRRPILNSTETSQILADKMTRDSGGRLWNAFLCVKAAGADGIIRPEVDELMGLQMCSTCSLMKTLEDAGYIVSFGKRMRADGTGSLCKIYYVPEFI